MALAQEYRISDRASIYRHAHAFGLFAKRQQNLKAALGRIIERVDSVEVTASAIVSAVQTLAKINAAGRWLDTSEQVSLRELFERMTREELEVYAKEGELPNWFADLTKPERNLSSL